MVPRTAQGRKLLFLMIGIVILTAFVLSSAKQLLLNTDRIDA